MLVLNTIYSCRTIIKVIVRSRYEVSNYVTLVISNCVLFNGSAKYFGGGLWLFVTIQSAVITIESTDFVDNHGPSISDIYIDITATLPSPEADITFFMLNSNVQSEQHSTDYGVYVHTEGCSAI